MNFTMTKQARVHPLRRLSVSEEQEMKEVNHNDNIKSRKASWQTIGQEVKTVSQWKSYRSSMRDRSLNAGLKVYDSFKKTQLCVLDSDVDNLGEQNFSPNGYKGYSRQLVSSDHTVTTNEALISSRTMIIYFAKLAKASLEEEQVIDFDFLQELLDDGADINFKDRHGQTVFHEVARIWNVDVAKFVLENGGTVNSTDDYGRTPLHVAAAVDYPDMIDFLVNNKVTFSPHVTIRKLDPILASDHPYLGPAHCFRFPKMVAFESFDCKFILDFTANIHAQTKGEMQTPIHYAAKNDARQALKLLLKLGANMDDRDYKNRTPLQVAAELDRSDTAKCLIDKGIAAGVQDDSGTCALSFMISKMPPVAKEALDQFHSTDRANRKQYYYLNYLEPYKPQKGYESYAKTPLQCVVLFKQMDLIMHPVFQRLIDVKWQQFGRRGVVFQLLVQLFYVFIWTALAVTLHVREDANFYNPLSKYWWRIVLETIACSMTIYFILQEFLEISASKRNHRRWQSWRVQELEKDLQFCHPRWPEERKYLEMELREISESGISYFNDAWNYFDWITYGWVLGMVITRVVDVAIAGGRSPSLHLRVSAVGIIFIWLRLMKAFRAFSTLGPFIVMIGHIIDDTLKFAVLFFGFYIPYVCAFWILFGGPKNAITMKAAQQSNVEGWEKFNDLMYSVWQLTYVGNFPWESLVAVDRFMAQLLCGTYIAVSGIILLNLFIALMSDTFQRVHDNAKANSAMQRASTILSLEESMTTSGREKHRCYVHHKLAPEELYYDDDSTGPQSGDLERMTHQIKDVVDEVLECLVRDGVTNRSDNANTAITRLHDDLFRSSERHEEGINAVRQEVADIKQVLNLLTRTLQQQTLLPTVNPQQVPSSPLVTHVKPSRPPSARLLHRKKQQKDQSFPSDEDEPYDQVPYEGLPLPTTIAELPSVSAITARKKLHRYAKHS